MAFLHPVHIGDLLTLHAQVNAVWHSSMEVGVRVEAEDPRTRAVRHTNSAYFTMVALDDDGRPVPVRPLVAQGPVEQRRLREAQLRRRNRLAERAQILHVREVPVDHGEGPAPPSAEHARESRDH